MEAALYAEVYLVCIIVVSLLAFWSVRRDTRSVEESWLMYVLLAFWGNFAANFFFKLFNGRLIGSEAMFLPASYLFKTLYFITLDLGVFAWCGYAETEQKNYIFQNKKTLRWLMLPLAVPVAAALVNLKTHHLFEITAAGAYQRNLLFQVEMGFLLVCSLICSVRLLLHSRRESDPAQRAHLRLTASFPLCILAAWLLSFIGEAVPVICVCLMVELLCLYTGTHNQQISLDKLTQVNNRQNLMGFLNYKLRSHDEAVFLLMLDVDSFKTINDTYGHLEGDRALTDTAAALKRACGPFKKRPYIARYGGDEFIIVMEGTETDLAALKAGIDDALAAVRRADAPYPLSLSIGAAKYRAAMSVKELIAEADADMYQHKHTRR